MFDRSDRVTAIIPFFIVFLAAAIGMKSNVDLFSWWHLIYHPEVFPHSIQHERDVR